jgi:predicted ATPase/DNA-binding SARP family transcriptional activator
MIRREGEPGMKIETPAANIRLYLLGSFRLERDSRAINLPTRKVESLLAYLALFPQPHSREHLAALLWGDSTDEQARASLRTALAAIRKELGDDILFTDRETVQLNPDFPIWVDAKDIFDLRSFGFAQDMFSIADSEIENLKSKIENYRGDLLPDFYDDWIIHERERLRAIYIDVLLHLAQHHREKSEYVCAVSIAQKVLGIDRANENAHQHLIFCYAAQGDRIAALKQYDECKKVLRDELNVEPSSETTALRDQIMQEPTGVPSREAALTNLPNPLTSFVGREKEQRELRGLFEKTRLLTLTGAGGCGKTRLALRVASDLRDTYADGVCWVELAPLADATLLPQAIAQALNTVEQPGRALLDVILDLLHGKHLLLVLDNCEHLARACAEFAHDVLCDAPQVNILATSREPLAVTGEMLYPVAPLAVPPKSQVTEIAAFDAIRLFVERARGVLPNFALTSTNAQTVADICRRLDGIPLAIELASARVNALTVEQIAARLDDRFALLTSARHGVPSHHRTLRAALDWSYTFLSAQEQILLRRLSVFAGGFSLEAVETVCADAETRGGGDAEKDRLAASPRHPLPVSSIVDGLSSLVNKSLVVAETLKPGEARYAMLETIRQYAGDKLRESGEGETIRNRHLDYFLRFAQDAEPRLQSPTIRVAGAIGCRA